MAKKTKGQPFDARYKKACNNSYSADSGWLLAAELLQRYLSNHAKVDELLAELPSETPAFIRRRAQALFYGAVRWLGLHQSILKQHVSRRPRPRLEALLLIACEELRESLMGEARGHAAQIVDETVRQASRSVSKPEAGFVNAVLRRCASSLERELGEDKVSADALGTAVPPLTEAAALAARWSHPEWLVKRWLNNFGRNETTTLLRWNQQPAITSFCKSRAVQQPHKERSCKPGDAPLLDVLLLEHPSGCRGFYTTAPKSAWVDLEPFLNGGAIFAMDPAQRHPAGLLSVQAGECVLELCAAPGGKSRMLLDALATVKASLCEENPQASGRNRNNGQLVCVDLPGPRFERLRGSLNAHIRGQEAAGLQPPKLTLHAADILDLTPDALLAHGLPGSYEAILLDAPCSNTGVLRRRPDAKWRISQDAIERAVLLQEALLLRALDLLAPAGRLVYATCSIEPEENRLLVDKILSIRHELTLVGYAESFPPADGHDGASAYLFHSKSTKR